MNKKYKVVVTGHAFPSLDIERSILGDIGEVVEYFPKSREELLDAVRDADAIMNQKSWIDDGVIAHMTKCKVIVQYGIGTDKIDLVAAGKKNIPVCNVPDYCVEEVATHAIALLLAFERRIPLQSAHLRSGEWTFSTKGDSARLQERTLGLLGFGRIARRVAEFASAFNLEILVNDPMLPAGAIEAKGFKVASFDELLQCQYLSIHCPLTEHTRGLFNSETFARMSPHSVLLNVSRGPIVVESDLLNALQSGRIRGAALDVFEKEPVPADNPLLQLENVVATPHTAWFSDEALRQLQTEVASDVRRVLNGQKPKNCVNLPQ